MVVRDVPPGATAVGIPARIIETEQAQKREEHAGLVDPKMDEEALATADKFDPIMPLKNS